MIDSIADTAHRSLRIAGFGYALITAMTVLTAPAAAQDVDKALEARMERKNLNGVAARSRSAIPRATTRRTAATSPARRSKPGRPATCVTTS
jgi:hypothetical protein